MLWLSWSLKLWGSSPITVLDGFYAPQSQPHQVSHMQAQAMPCWKNPTNTHYSAFIPYTKILYLTFNSPTIVEPWDKSDLVSCPPVLSFRTVSPQYKANNQRQKNKKKSCNETFNANKDGAKWVSYYRVHRLPEKRDPSCTMWPL